LVEARKLNPTVSETSKMNGSLEEEIRRLQRELGEKSDITELQMQKEQALQQRQKVLYGVDLCFIMDCTGSMRPWIEAAKNKIRELAAAVKNIKTTKKPHFRIAFLGYRDIDHGPQRYVPIDFFDLEDQGAVAKFQKVLSETKPIGGNDPAEDIAGAMNYVLSRMSWKSSTRLVIHFADAPCHGKKYHDIYDRFPEGDPDGLVPEDLLEKFAGKTITYYFGEIDPDTRKMTTILTNHMTRLQKGAMFHVIPMNSGVESFLPRVVESITQSMTQSGLFGME